MSLSSNDRKGLLLPPSSAGGGSNPHMIRAPHAPGISAAGSDALGFGDVGPNYQDPGNYFDNISQHSLGLDSRTVITIVNNEIKILMQNYMGSNEDLVLLTRIYSPFPVNWEIDSIHLEKQYMHLQNPRRVGAQQQGYVPTFSREGRSTRASRWIKNFNYDADLMFSEKWEAEMNDFLSKISASFDLDFKAMIYRELLSVPTVPNEVRFSDNQPVSIINLTKDFFAGLGLFNRNKNNTIENLFAMARDRFKPRTEYQPEYLVTTPRVARVQNLLTSKSIDSQSGGGASSYTSAAERALVYNDSSIKTVMCSMKDKTVGKDYILTQRMILGDALVQPEGAPFTTKLAGYCYGTDREEEWSVYDITKAFCKLFFTDGGRLPPINPDADLRDLFDGSVQLDEGLFYDKGGRPHKTIGHIPESKCPTDQVAGWFRDLARFSETSAAFSAFRNNVIVTDEGMGFFESFLDEILGPADSSHKRTTNLLKMAGAVAIAAAAVPVDYAPLVAGGDLKTRFLSDVGKVHDVVSFNASVAAAVAGGAAFLGVPVTSEQVASMALNAGAAPRDYVFTGPAYPGLNPVLRRPVGPAAVVAYAGAHGGVNPLFHLLDYMLSNWIERVKTSELMVFFYLKYINRVEELSVAGRGARYGVGAGAGVVGGVTNAQALFVAKQVLASLLPYFTASGEQGLWVELANDLNQKEAAAGVSFSAHVDFAYGKYEIKGFPILLPGFDVTGMVDQGGAGDIELNHEMFYNSGVAEVVLAGAGGAVGAANIVIATTAAGMNIGCGDITNVGVGAVMGGVANPPLTIENASTFTRVNIRKVRAMAMTLGDLAAVKMHTAIVTTYMAHASRYPAILSELYSHRLPTIAAVSRGDEELAANLRWYFSRPMTVDSLLFLAREAIPLPWLSGMIAYNRLVADTSVITATKIGYVGISGIYANRFEHAEGVQAIVRMQARFMIITAEPEAVEKIFGSLIVGADMRCGKDFYPGADDPNDFVQWFSTYKRFPTSKTLFPIALPYGDSSASNKFSPMFRYFSPPDRGEASKIAENNLPLNQYGAMFSAKFKDQLSALKSQVETRSDEYQSDHTLHDGSGHLNYPLMAERVSVSYRERHDPSTIKTCVYESTFPPEFKNGSSKYRFGEDSYLANIVATR